MHIQSMSVCHLTNLYHTTSNTLLGNIRQGLGLTFTSARHLADWPAGRCTSNCGSQLEEMGTSYSSSRRGSCVRTPRESTIVLSSHRSMAWSSLPSCSGLPSELPKGSSVMLG